MAAPLFGEAPLSLDPEVAWTQAIAQDGSRQRGLARPARAGQRRRGPVCGHDL